MATSTSEPPIRLDEDYHWTRRQKQVLELITRGYTNGRIGEELGVSLDGAKWHVREILSKLGVDTREEAAEYWRAYNGLGTRLTRLFRGFMAAGTLRWTAAGAAVLVGASGIVLAALLWAGNDTGGDEGPQALAPPSETVPPEPDATVAAMEVDGDGWPTVECPGDFPVVRVDTRRISGCAPPGLTLQEQHEYVGDDPSGQIRLALMWNDPENPGDFVALQVIDKATGDGETLQSQCAHPTQEVLLGHAAEQCLWNSTSPNGDINGLWGIVWGVQRFAESPDYWLIANASGPQSDEEQVAAIERAVTVFDSFLANGLERVR